MLLEGNLITSPLLSITLVPRYTKRQMILVGKYDSYSHMCEVYKLSFLSHLITDGWFSQGETIHRVHFTNIQELNLTNPLPMYRSQPKSQSNPLASICFKSIGPNAKSRPISIWGTNAWSGSSTRLGSISNGNGSALGEIACQTLFGNGYKFQESCISHEKQVPSGREYILEGPTNMKSFLLIMMTPLREVYK